MQIIELDSFVAAFPVQPGREAAAKRRFMTLFASDDGQAHAGGTSYVVRAQSFTGETFALKRLLAGNVPADAKLSDEDRSRITQGHEAAFYEEYKNQLLVSRMRGFPRLYGYGHIGDDPVIVMEWVEGVSLQQILRDGTPMDGRTMAQIGVAVLDALDGIGRLDATLAHRDISPANIMVRTDDSSLEEQMARGVLDICLVDFGSAAESSPDNPSFTMSSQVWRNGTPEYAPPEMLTRDMPHIDRLRKSQAIDVFALCSVLYELYAGHTPWRVGEHPEASPYRLKTERPPEPLVARAPADAPLAQAIESGLAIRQEDRPTVAALLSALQEYLGTSDGSETNTGTATAEPTGKRPSLAARMAPGGLYTPDSTRLEVAPPSEGGRRAGEDVPAYQARGMSRRQFVLGGIVIAAAAIAGAGLTARSCTPQAAFDFSGYAVTDAIWDGAPLYPVKQLASSAWSLLEPTSGYRPSLGSVTREPGRFIDGLVRVFDPASGGYGYMTPTSKDDIACSWAILPMFADAGDFSPTDGVAAAQDAESGLWGYIDRTGAWAIAPSFAQAMRFSHGVAAVRKSDEAGWNLIDVSGSTRPVSRTRAIGIRSEEGLMAAADTESGLWGCIDDTGEWAIEPAFAQLRRFSGGMAAFQQERNGLWGILDAQGTATVKPRFADMLPFADGVAPAQDAGTLLWGLVDISGTWRLDPRYLRLGEKTGDLFPAHGSPADVYDIDGADTRKWQAYLDAGNGDIAFGYGYIDETGWVVNPTYGDTLIRNPEQ